MTMSLRPFTRLAGAVALVLLAACGGNAEEDGDEPVNAGFVRFVNATPGALSLYDVNTSSTVAAAGANSASGYVDRLPESHEFLLLGTNGAQVANLTAGVARQERYTLVAARSGNGYSTQLLTDNESTPASGAKLRVYNAASADVGSLDVYLAGSSCANLVGPAFSNVNSLTGFRVVGAGTAFRVCVTTQGDPTDLRLEIPGVAFGNEQVVTLVLARGRGGVLVDGMLVVQRGAVSAATNTSARIRLVADITAGTSVVASANGVSLGSSAQSPAVGGYVLVPAGNVNLGATLGTTDTTLVADAPAAGGGDYTLLLTGTVAAPSATLITDDNTTSTSAANPVKLRLVNGLNGVTGSASFSYESSFAGSAAFGTASATVLRPVTTGAPVIEATFGATTLPVPTTAALAAGKVYTLFLLGTPTAPVAKLSPDR